MSHGITIAVGGSDGASSGNKLGQRPSGFGERRASRMVPEGDMSPSSGSQSLALPSVGGPQRRASVQQGRRASRMVTLGSVQGGSSAASKVSPKAPPPPPASGNGSFAKTMDATAKRITAAVSSLYKAPLKADPKLKANSKKSKDAKHGHGRASLVHSDNARRSLLGGISEDGPEEHDSASSSGGSSQAGGKDEPVEEEPSDDDYDFKQSAAKVTDLLDSLKCEDRLDLMMDLNSFYSQRRNEVENDTKELGAIEDEFQMREEETKHSMQTMLTSFEDKQMREVKVLVKCNKTLKLGARNMLKQRRVFAKSSPLAKKLPRKVSRFSDEEGEGGGGDNARHGEIKSEGWKLDEQAGQGEAADANQDEGGSKRVRLFVDEHAHLDPLKKREILNGLDVEGARKKLQEMHEAPQRVLAMVHSEEPPAADVLEALSQVQQGQMELEAQAKLAVKSAEISKAALAHLTEGTGDPSAAVLELLEEMRMGIFGENGEEMATGPDPEELEEECQMLEGMIAKQDKDLEALRKTREQSAKLARDADEDDHKAHDDGDDAKSDASEEEKPRMMKSELRDGRIEAAQAASKQQLTGSAPVKVGMAALQRVKNQVKVQRIVRDLTKGKEESESKASVTKKIPKGSPDSDKVSTAQDAHQKMQLVQQKINEKEFKIARVKEVHQQMKKEFALLKYCAMKSDAGLEAILSSFNPDEAGGDSESSYESSEDDNKPNKKKKKKVKHDTSDQDAPEETPAEDETEQSDDGKTTTKKNARKNVVKHKTQSVVDAKGSKVAKGSKQKEKEVISNPKTGPPSEAIDKHRKVDLTSLQAQVGNFNQRKLEEAETEMKQRIEELTNEIATDIQLIKSEKKRQVGLKKDINKLKKSFATKAKQHKGAPTSLDALDKQLTMLGEGEAKLQGQILDLTAELTRQQRLLEKAQSEGQEAQERKSRLSASGPIPAAAMGLGALPFANPAVAAPCAEATSSAAAEDEAAPSGKVRFSIPAQQGGEVVTAAEPSRSSVVLADVPAAPDGSAAHSGTPLAVSRASTKGVSFENLDASRDGDATSKSAGLADLQTGLQKATTPAVQISSHVTSQDLSSHATKAAPTASSAMSVNHEDLAELVRLQSRNEDLKNEIDEMMHKMQQLRTAMKRGKSTALNNEAIREIVGGPLSAEEAKPPPEYASLKKDVRTKQNEVRNLRKQWWTDHKDLDLLAERVKHNQYYEEEGGGSTQGRPPAHVDPSNNATSQRLSHGTAQAMPDNWVSNTRRGTDMQHHLGHATTIGFEAVISGNHVNTGHEDEHPQHHGHLQDHPKFRKTTTVGAEALMSSPIFNANSIKRQSSAVAHLAAAHAAADMLGASGDESKDALIAEGVRGRFHGVRKSLVLSSRSLKDLVGDDDVDIHDRSFHYSENPAHKIHHPLAPDPPIAKKKSMFGEPVDLRVQKHRGATVNF